MAITQTKPDKKKLEQMLLAACHFGHRVSKWNPKMKQFLYTKRDDIHIFDLEKTYKYLTKALNFLRESVAAGRTVLLVSTKLQATKLMTDAAIRCECPFVTRKWMPGLLTNFDTIRRRIKYFRDLKEQKRTGGWDKYKKKERLDLQRTLDKLEDAFSGVENVMRVPDVVVVLDSIHDMLTLKEAKRLGIPTIGICDSNSDPDLVTYPIPGNDDAIKSLKFFTEQISNAILEGKKMQEKAPAAAAKKVEAPATPSRAYTPVV